MTPLKKVQAGDPLTFPAATFNAFVDAAQGYRARGGVGGSVAPDVLSGGVVQAWNGCSSDLDRFQVVGVSAPLYDPTTDLAAFKRSRAAVKVVEPVALAHQFGIVQTPARVGGICQVMLAGISPVQIHVTDEDHMAAKPKAVQPSTELESSHAGSALVLWKEPGESSPGGKWALVQFGGGLVSTIKQTVRFTLDDDLFTYSPSEYATITAQYGPGKDNPDTAITVKNMQTGDPAGTYLFEGDEDAAGLAVWDTGQSYVIIQMECP
jgi:hypothetical protein